MFWGLASGAVGLRDFKFEHVLHDIQTLNELALEGRLEVSVISLHTYPFVQDRYIILPHGASMGSGYGPVVITREPMSPEDLRDVEIAVPGRMTTAYLVLRLFLGGDFRHRELRSDQIMAEVRSGGSDAGLLIHEGQLTYGRQGFHRVVDLGEWWLLETGLPLPLGISVARRDLGAEILHEICEVLAESIKVGLASRTEALEYAMQYGRGLDPGLTDRFVGMYVNELMQDYGDEGRQAVRELLERGERAGAFDEPVRIEFVS